MHQTPSKGTRMWLREVCGPGTRPEFDRERKVWTVARPRFRRVVEALALRYGAVDVYVDHTVRSVCGKLCREAEDDDCTCSYLGGQPRHLLVAPGMVQGERALAGPNSRVPSDHSIIEAESAHTRSTQHCRLLRRREADTRKGR
jgi:hypothetical protein